MPIKLKERDIAKTFGDYLKLDGWRLLWCEPMSRRDLGKGFGEPGMPDLLAIRYAQNPEWSVNVRLEIKLGCDVIWIEFKRPGGRLSAKQKEWHLAERSRGALTIILGEDCEASIEGWLSWYSGRGLNRGRV